MSSTLQDFLADATQRAMTNLITAYLRLPEDKRAWSPADTARTALDQVAECALNNGYTADLIETRQWVMNDFGAYVQEKARVGAQEWDVLQTQLQKSTQRVIKVIRAVPDTDLGIPIVMPWETQSMAQVIAYPYWNMTYHEGQINYLASILGCLE